MGGEAYSGGWRLVEVVRSGCVECFHHGSVVVVDARGAVLDSAGDVSGPIFPRSSNKPLQALGMLRAGLAPAVAADLALVCGSHLGQDFHAARVREMLGRAGLDEAALRCPPSLPLDEPARTAVLAAGGGPTRVRHNCSGKHAGMLATCVAAGWPVETYRDPAHPLQRRLHDTVAEYAGEPVASVGVDGCGAALFAVSLTGLATAFRALVGGAPGSAEHTVAGAMRAHPEYVAGTGAADTRLMAAVPGLVVKSGAEGVAAAAYPGAGAVALKIDDGAARARLPVLVSALRRLGVECPELGDLTAVYGGGRPVGDARSVW